jgi:hypothetical protein
VEISVRPDVYSVDAVARMMKYMMMFENSIPMAMSHRDWRSSSLVAPCRSLRRRRPMAISSSTSSLDCQVYR